MGHKFTQLASSRASYYCKGSPVHFVRVELFCVEETGDTAVTLTFKNLHTHVLRDFTAYFRCRNRDGEILIEDSFTYENVNAAEGESFGCDEAVFVSDEPLSNVEVRLASVTYEDGVPHDLRRCTAVALPALRPLPPGACESLRMTLGIRDAEFYPENAEDGWRCTCGAFNYNAGKGLYTCSECGVGKAQLRDALRAAAQRRRYDAGMQVLPVRDADAVPAAAQGRSIQYSARTVYAPRAGARGEPGQSAAIMKDSTADAILRYAPLVTAIAASVFTVGAVLVTLCLH